MTLSCSSTDFENDSDFRPPAVPVLPQIQVMPLNSLRISLADYVQLSPSGGIHTAASHPSSISPRQRWQQVHRRRPQRRHRCVHRIRAQQLSSGACHTRVNSQRWRGAPDVSPLFVHFAQTMTSPPGCMRARLPTAARVFKWRKNRVEANAHNAGRLPGIQRHSWPISMIFLVQKIVGWVAVRNCKAATFYGGESRDSVDVRRCFAVTHHPVGSWTGGDSW